MVTETMPGTRPVVAEPTTPIKPSEALRLGRLTHPNRPNGMLYVGPEGEACAIGAIAIGLGYDGPDDPDFGFAPAETFAEAQLGRELADAIERRYEGWHDGEPWSDDQIVAYLESRGL